MKCPRDVRRKDFDAMLRDMPPGSTLISSHKNRLTGATRDFLFLLGGPIFGFKRGDHLLLQCACKYERR